MKFKWFWCLVLCLSLFVTACSNRTSDSTEKAAGPAQDSAASVARQTIATATMSLTAKDYDRTEALIRQAGTNLGGYVSELNSTRTDNTQNGRVVMQIPAAKVQDFTEQIKALADVTVTSTEVALQDVTAESIDLDARLKALQAQKSRCEALLADAKTVDDVFKISQEIAKVQEQIESTQGRKNNLQTRIDYTPVTVEISAKPTEPKQGVWERTSTQFGKSLNGVGQFLVWLLVFGVGNFPVLLLIFLIVYGSLWLFWLRKRKQK
ncbi:DUF4349 domain-containing protein [Tumebacillus flagellatus]|uniref:DUF4349 domain-containing protein n=1 Tax=Tumebacillus flagellatus TaxID=1157490 RepID=A0A074LXB6_9BACL|nr:DUF4349 domain-containing protein [Tumebacillus flagellatus]KEO84728.1 hypothetical protein EL26_04215 [Tumebacillus flagellatus]